jgi:hypothetical protein
VCWRKEVLGVLGNDVNSDEGKKGRDFGVVGEGIWLVVWYCSFLWNWGVEVGSDLWDYSERKHIGAQFLDRSWALN